MATPRLRAGDLAAATTLAEPRLAPDGEQVAWVAADVAGVRVVVEPIEGGGPTVITDPVPRLRGGGLDWLTGGTLAVAGADGGVWLVGLDGDTPRQVADGDITGVAASPDGTRVAFVRDLRAVCVVGADGGEHVIDERHDFAFDPAWSPDSTRLAWHAWDVPAMPWDESVVMVAHTEDGSAARVVAGGPEVAVAQPLFLPDGRLGWLSDQTGWMVPWIEGAQDTEAEPALTTRFDHAPPAWGSGNRSWAVSPDGQFVVLDRNEQGFGRLVVHGLAKDRSDTWGRGVHGALSWRGGRVAALRSGARTPDEVVVIDAATGIRTAVARAADIDRDALVEPELVTFTAAGEEAVGRLYRPPGAHPPHPTVVWTHGGPHDQARVEWKHRIAFIVDQGWAVLCADHRGTTGHGRDWTQALRGQWGIVDVVDTLAAVDALVDRSLADRRMIVAGGSSAGGFTTLHLLARHPRRFAGGIALYPVADLVGLQESTHRFEAHYNDSLVGPWPDAASLYAERSPISVADGIKGPLLVLHGSDDEVVPVRQAMELAARVTAAGGEVDLKVFPGEGHGWHRPDVVAEELSRVGAFLRRIAGTG